MTTLKYLRVDFEQVIAARDLSAFKAAFLEKMKGRHDSFQPTRNGGSQIPKYPLVQFKRFHKKPVLICLNEAVDDVHRFFSGTDRTLELKGEQTQMGFENISFEEYELGIIEGEHLYRIWNWIPFGKQDQLKFDEEACLISRYGMLLHRLNHQIREMGRDLGWFSREKIRVCLKKVTESDTYRLNYRPALAFDLVFSSNFPLPNLIGLGHGLSEGFGTVKSIRKRNHEKVLSPAIA